MEHFETLEEWSSIRSRVLHSPLSISQPSGGVNSFPECHGISAIRLAGEIGGFWQDRRGDCKAIFGDGKGAVGVLGIARTAGGEDSELNAAKADAPHLNIGFFRRPLRVATTMWRMPSFWSLRKQGARRSTPTTGRRCRSWHTA